jgi:hypothetical protein
MSRDLAPLVQRIRSLLEQRGADPTMPLLTAMEHTLTDVYARSPGLDGDRLRLERRIGDLAHRLDGPEQAGELRELAERLRSTDDDLASLRDALAPLQQRVDAARAAA